MSDSDIAEDVEIEEVESGGGTVKRAVAALGLLAVLLVVLKLVGGGSDESEADLDDATDAVERVDDGDGDEPIDTVSTADEEDESDESDDDTLEVKSSAEDIAGGRFDDLDLVDYLAIFAAALQAARDEYRIRTER
jgi:hypothetical protein